MRQFGLSESMAGAAFDNLQDNGIRRLLEQSDEGIVCCRPGWIIMFANAAFKNLFRSQREEITLGASLRSILAQAVETGDLLATTSELEKWCNAFEQGRADGVFRLRCGRWIKLAGNCTSDDGRVLTIVDVTTFKKREAWLTELHDKLAGEGEDLKHFARHLAQARAEVSVALNQAEKANAALQKEIAERRSLERELRKLANTDELTGTLNRRRFMELSHHENTRARRQGRPLSILMMDLDHFKSINDVYGHEAGDEVLRQFAKVGISLFRESDLFARLGGEEFAALLPETDTKNAAIIAERIRAAVELLNVQFEDQTIGLAVSIGVASIADNDKTPLSFIGRADRALYQAKANGRNQVTIYDPKTIGKTRLAS